MFLAVDGALESILSAIIKLSTYIIMRSKNQGLVVIASGLNSRVDHEK